MDKEVDEDMDEQDTIFDEAENAGDVESVKAKTRRHSSDSDDSINGNIINSLCSKLHLF